MTYVPLETPFGGTCGVKKPTLGDLRGAFADVGLGRDFLYSGMHVDTLQEPEGKPAADRYAVTWESPVEAIAADLLRMMTRSALVLPYGAKIEAVQEPAHEHTMAIAVGRQATKGGLIVYSDGCMEIGIASIEPEAALPRVEHNGRPWYETTVEIPVEKLRAPRGVIFRVGARGLDMDVLAFPDPDGMLHAQLVHRGRLTDVHVMWPVSEGMAAASIFPATPAFGVHTRRSDQLLARAYGRHVV